MLTEEQRERNREYVALIIEGIISPFILYAFMSINIPLFIFGLVLIAIDLYTLYYSIVELKDPKLLIVFIITEFLTGGSNKK